MNFNKPLLWILCVTLVAASCTANDPIENVETPPTKEYVRLNLFGGCGHNAATEDSEVTRIVWNDSEGSGNLTLKWEQNDKLSLVVSDGEKPIMSRESSQPDDSCTETSHSSLLVTPCYDDAYHADFQSANYYATDDLQEAKYCYAVAGNARITEEAGNGEHICHFEMPSSFTQSTSQEPNFLRNYMFMYATTSYRTNGTTLNFNHIPAVFRFVVTSSKADAISLQEVSVSVSDESIIAAKSAKLLFDWSDGNAELLYGENGHKSVTVKTGNGVLSKGGEYTAYAMVLPLSDNSVFKGKTLNVNLKSDNQEQVVFQIDGAKLSEINGSEIYNWVSGKSYTIRINIREDGKATGVIEKDNRIKVTPVSSGIYTLVYEGEDGKPLADYTDICTLTIKELAYYEDFINENIAPRAAKAIGIYDSTGERQGTIPLATFKPDFSKEPLYSFGVLSDVHIGRAEINPETDFERALKFFNAKGVAHTCICGDISQNGTVSEFQSWQAVAALANAPIYTTTGNHDATKNGIAPDVWATYTGLPLVFERSVESNGKVDHFLFLGMSVWNFTAGYLDYHLAWLESKLEAYRNERCFVITHLFFPERAGNLNNIYPSGNWLRGEQLEKLEALCDNYVNSIWFSGHSHWEWQLQKYQDRANIYRTYNAALQPTSGWCVHIPSCGVPITSNGSSREDNTEGSEGTIVEVYENHIDILGVDFKSGKYLPIATYRLDTAPQTVAATSATIPSYYISASNFVENTKKKGATVKDVAGMPNYIDVTFTAKSQGFYVSNSTFTTGTTKASITIEDVQAFSNGVAVDIPAGVGFYSSSSYYLISTDKAEVKPDTYTGVQFQTSGSKYGDGPLPLTLRMKCLIKFYE